MANCNCNCKNGQDALDFLTSVPGGTAANATYQLGLTHYTCGNRIAITTSINVTTA